MEPELLQRLHASLARELLELTQDLYGRLQELDESAEAARLDGVEDLRQIAHTIKGAVLNLGAGPLQVFAAELEEILAAAAEDGRWLRTEEVERVEDLGDLLVQTVARMASEGRGSSSKWADGGGQPPSEDRRAGDLVGPPGEDEAPLRLVLADDSESARRVLRAILQGGDDFQVAGEAADGLEAVEQTRAHLPDAVVMDLAMPTLNGIEAARRILDEIPTPILLVSALEEITELDLEAEGLDPSLVALLPKPHLGQRGVEIVGRVELRERLRDLCRLPVRRRVGRPHENPKVTPIPGPLLGPKLEVLLVEDSSSQAEFLTAYLEDSGFRVRRARDASEAWSEAQRKSPDLVLSDVILPGGSGFDLCCALKASERTRRLPVVFLSASVGPMQLARGLASGAAAFLAKPWAPEELAPRLRSLAMEVDAPPAGQEDVEVRVRGETLWVDPRPERILRFMVEALEEGLRAKGQLEAGRLRLAAEAREGGAAR